VPKLRFRLVHRDESFYELFVRLATKVYEGATAYEEMVATFEDLPAGARRLKDIEHEGDESTHEIMRRLNSVFVTPFDHEDIHKLASELDDVLDHIEAAADLLVLHKIEEPLPDMKVQATILVQAARLTLDAMGKLPRFRELADYWMEIDRLEKEGDRIYRHAVADLFGGDHPAMDVLKLKDIIDELEAGIDKLEDVSDVLESIALKNA
jgi:predicted phosphate transport protein (TIGR00153 family)